MSLQKCALQVSDIALQQVGKFDYFGPVWGAIYE